jgi:hypothetical protein
MAEGATMIVICRKWGKCTVEFQVLSSANGTVLPPAIRLLAGRCGDRLMLCNGELLFSGASARSNMLESATILVCIMHVSAIQRVH